MIKKLQEQIKSTDVDAALIVSEQNRFYFTGFDSSDGYLIVSGNDAVFITDGRYIEAANAKAQNCKVVLQQRSRTQLNDILISMGAHKVFVEASKMSLKEYSLMVNTLKDIEIIADNQLDNIIENIRSVKSDNEVIKIKTAQRIAEKAFEHICNYIKPGITEKEIALELDYFMLRNGADALSFETIAVSGVKGSMPHGVPDEKVVENGEFITMDFGAVFEGYHSDMTRTVAVGKVSSEQKLVYETVLNAQTACLEVVKAGMSCKQADMVAREVIEKAGFGEYFTHSTGHGVGVEIHESPNVSPASDKILETGNIITVEPGIYIPEKFGVRIEDMALITDNGCENLTICPKQLIIL